MLFIFLEDTIAIYNALLVALTHARAHTHERTRIQGTCFEIDTHIFVLCANKFSPISIDFIVNKNMHVYEERSLKFLAYDGEDAINL